MGARLIDWARRVNREIKGTFAEVGEMLRGLPRACTCGDPRHPGPCPRHHTTG